MEYSKLVAVTGLPRLFELVSSKTDGAIVRSLDDNSTKFASSRIHQFSHLESIEVYTVNDNVNLVEVFQAMEKGAGSLPDGKDNAALKSYFQKVYPDMDFERVYASDLKKMVKWFEILQKQKIELKLSEVVEEEEVVEEAPAPKVKEAKKEKAEEKEVKKEKAEKKEATEEKPVAKKTTAKKNDESDQKPAKKKEAKESAPEAKQSEAPKKKAAPKKK